jgi:Mn-containing catalase
LKCSAASRAGRCTSPKVSGPGVGIAAKEIGQVEMLATMIAQLLKKAPSA